MDINISSQIVVNDSSSWASDSTVYSGSRILITSNDYYGNTDQRKFKIPDGVNTWSQLDYFPVSGFDDATSSIQGQFNNITSSFVPNSVSSSMTVLSSSYAITASHALNSNSGGSSYWNTVPGTPTRIGNTSFSITDTGNANLYNLLLGRTTVLKWTDSGDTKMAMINSSSYSSNTVTINLIGDTLSANATMSTFKYSIEKAKSELFAVAGTIAVGNNIGRKFFSKTALKIFGADGNHGTAGTTNATTYTLSKNQIDGTGTILSSAISIASGATSGNGYTVSDGMTMMLDDYLTINCTGVSTIAPIDTYIIVFVTSLYNQYLN